MLLEDIDGDDGPDVVPAPVVPRRRGAHQKRVQTYGATSLFALVCWASTHAVGQNA